MEHTHPLASQFFNHVAQTSPESIALPAERAEGVYIYGPNGERWIDLVSGICVNNLGHSDPDILQAIDTQVHKYLHPMVYGEAIMAPQVQYAARLAEVLGPGFESVYFLNSGAEAIEGAMKVAKKFTGRSEIIAFHNSYHGNSHGALSVTGNDSMKVGYGPFLPRIEFLKFNDFADLQRITSQTAAVVTEAIQGAGGVILPENGFLKALQDRCRETGTLLILDEIQTGFGRTGALFAHHLYGIRPDILVLAKALGGGMPLGAFITRHEVMDVIQANPVLGHITTFGGHPVSCAAGLALLNKLIQNRLLDRIPALEAVFRTRLTHPQVLGLRGLGLFFSVIFRDKTFAEAVRAEAYRRGVISIGFLNDEAGLRICPPLTMTVEEAETACRILLESVDAVSRQVS